MASEGVWNCKEWWMVWVLFRIMVPDFYWKSSWSKQVLASGQTQQWPWPCLLCIILKTIMRNRNLPETCGGSSPCSSASDSGIRTAKNSKSLMKVVIQFIRLIFHVCSTTTTTTTTPSAKKAARAMSQQFHKTRAYLDLNLPKTEISMYIENWGSRENPPKMRDYCIWPANLKSPW